MAFPWFLHPPSSLISNCLSLLFGTQRRPRRLKPFSINMKWGIQGEFYTLAGRPCKVLLSFNPSFSLFLLSPQGNRGKTRKGIMFWIKRLIINLAGELCFRKPQFQKYPVTPKMGEAFVAQSCLTLCYPHSLPGSSVNGILQARILEWFAIPFSWVSS